MSFGSIVLIFKNFFFLVGELF